MEDLMKIKGGSIVVGLGVLVFLLTYLFKYPIKKLTSKIQDDNKRQIVNKIILLIPFALGLLAEFVFDYTKGLPFDYNKGLTIGLTSISIYATFEKLFYKKNKTEYDSEDAKKIIEVIENEKKTSRFLPEDSKKKKIKDAEDIAKEFINALNKD